MPKSTENKLIEVNNKTYLPESTQDMHGDSGERTYEFTVVWNCHIFNIVFGQYSHGWFVAVVNWGKCFNAAHPVDVSDNSKLFCEALGFSENVTYMLAEKIKEKWENRAKGGENNERI